MTHWISRLGRRLASLTHLPGTFGGPDEGDADARAARSTLDAIRMHFPDHA